MSVFKNVCSVSFFATAFMVLYIGLAGYNMYLMMFPLAQIDIAAFPQHEMVHPLWEEGTVMDMRVYLSTKTRFNVNFIQSEYLNEDGEIADPKIAGTKFVPPKDVALLWKQEIKAPSLSKSFLITKKGTPLEDASRVAAQEWLDSAEQQAMERGEGGVLSAIQQSGQGIESTSFLLTLYYAMSRNIQSMLAMIGLAEPLPAEDSSDKLLEELKQDRATITLPSTSPLWKALRSNSTFYLHVMVLRQSSSTTSNSKTTAQTVAEATNMVHQASRGHSILLGQVNMVKFEEPHHIQKPKRILWHDLVWMIQHYLLGSTKTPPPWDFAYSKPKDHAIYQDYLDMKERGATYPYWKPEVSIKYVKDEESYPYSVAQLAGMQLVRLPTGKSSQHPTGIAHLPALYSSEIGLTSDKFLPINETVSALPLRVSFDRSDVSSEEEGQSKVTTATAGAISPARWRLLRHLTDAIEAQKSLGFEQSDIDEVKLLIADTNITLLAITMLASALHLLFEFLTFKSEVNFWRENKDLTGLSVRALFMDVFGQTVILLYLIERESSLLMVGPSAVGCLIAAWKCRRASGLMFVPTNSNNYKPSAAWYNKIFRMVGYELRATRLEAVTNNIKDDDKDDKNKSNKQKNKKNSSADKSNNNNNSSSSQSHDHDLTALTLESDRAATRTLGVLMGPLVLGYVIYSLIQVEHNGWYSWLVTSASSAVYALGFVMMTPQLFLNWKLKSVAHLPWQVLIYRSLNTFIDDLFSFIVRMPTMARISCFRDDVVFIIYLYQRWLYPVDKSRPVEGGGGPLEEEDEKEKVSETKKKQ